MVKLNDPAWRERPGGRSRDPCWAVAYKFKPRRDTARVEEIIVNVGPTGTLTPVGLLEPVHVGGVEVSRAPRCTTSARWSKRISGSAITWWWSGRATL